MYLSASVEDAPQGEPGPREPQLLASLGRSLGVVSDKFAQLGATPYNREILLLLLLLRRRRRILLLIILPRLLASLGRIYIYIYISFRASGGIY